MPSINIKIEKGRAVDVKRRLVKELTQVVVENLGVLPDRVTITIDEYDRENWGTGGELHIDKYGNPQIC